MLRTKGSRYKTRWSSILPAVSSSAVAGVGTPFPDEVFFFADDDDDVDIEAAVDVDICCIDGGFIDTMRSSGSRIEPKTTNMVSNASHDDT